MQQELVGFANFPTGGYHKPAITTSPLGDDLCAQYHSDNSVLPPHPRTPPLANLSAAVGDAAEFLSKADESLADDFQTSREVLSHLVFWHREYVKIARAICRGSEPAFRVGKYRELNALAATEFRQISMPALAARLLRLQKQLAALGSAIPPVSFPLKENATCHTLDEWAPQIEAHIRGHLLRLSRAQERYRTSARKSKRTTS